MTSLSTAKFSFFGIYNLNTWSCWLNDKEWFLNSTCSFCRKMCTIRLLLDYFWNRSKHAVVPYVKGFTVQASAASRASFPPFLWAPPSPKSYTPSAQLHRMRGGVEGRSIFALPHWTDLSSACTELCYLSTQPTPTRSLIPSWNGASGPSLASPAEPFFLPCALTAYCTFFHASNYHTVC